MKHTTIFCAVAVLALAGCATTPNDTTMGGQPANMGSQSTTPTQPATNVANSPGSGMQNTGGGLSQSMTPDEAAMAFHNLDDNRDGYIDRTEFTKFGDSGQRFVGCDTNGDGKLTQSEYVTCSQRPASTGQ